MISPLSNTADITAHIIRLVENESTRDVKDIFVDKTQIVSANSQLGQVTPDYSYEQLLWPETTTDAQVPALNSLLSWFGQQERESGNTNVSVTRVRKYAPLLAEDGARGSKGQEGKEGN